MIFLYDVVKSGNGSQNFKEGGRGVSLKLRLTDTTAKSSYSAAPPPTRTHLTSCSTEFVMRSDPSRRVPRSGLAGPEEPVRECSAAASLSQNVGSRGGVLVWDPYVAVPLLQALALRR